LIDTEAKLEKGRLKMCFQTTFLVWMLVKTANRKLKSSSPARILGNGLVALPCPNPSLLLAAVYQALSRLAGTHHKKVV
jgi:hypothetical protein